MLSNWEKQIEEHCTRGALSSCVYYGASRSMGPEELQELDVVITTYQTITGEHSDGKTSSEGSSKKKKRLDSSLFEVQWKASILPTIPSRDSRNCTLRESYWTKDTQSATLKQRWLRPYTD